MCLYVVDNPYFEWFVLILIFASSVTLCFEDVHLDSKTELKVKYTLLHTSDSTLEKILGTSVV